MANFVSKLGIWKPAQERAVLPDAPEGQEIYEGPDRDAMAILKEQGVDHLGVDCQHDPEMMIRARQANCKDVKEYLKQIHNIDIKDLGDNADKKAKEVVTHKNTSPKKAHKEIGGGYDRSGEGNSIEGGFGDYKEVFTKK